MWHRFKYCLYNFFVNFFQISENKIITKDVFKSLALKSLLKFICSSLFFFGGIRIYDRIPVTGSKTFLDVSLTLCLHSTYLYKIFTYWAFIDNFFLCLNTLVFKVRFSQSILFTLNVRFCHKVLKSFAIKM